jgi:hypothetical protein
MKLRLGTWICPKHVENSESGNCDCFSRRQRRKILTFGPWWIVSAFVFSEGKFKNKLFKVIGINF